MGLIRKTMSISTLGLVNWRSKKERLHAAMEELELTRSDLEQATEKHALIKDRLETAERRAREAELHALKDSRRARRRGRREVASSVGLGRVAKAGFREKLDPLIDSTRENTRRFAADHEPAVDEFKDRGRKARADAEKQAKVLRKRAEKATRKARKRGKALRGQAAESAEHAAGAVRHRAGELTRS